MLPLLTTSWLTTFLRTRTAGFPGTWGALQFLRGRFRNHLHPIALPGRPSWQCRCRRAGISLAAGLRRVQRHGSENKRLQCLLVNLIALVEIDGAPGIAFEAGVEKS